MSALRAGVLSIFRGVQRYNVGREWVFIDVLLFVFFALWFVLWRYGHPVVWDDTNIVKQVWTPMLGAGLLDIAGSGYRPVARGWVWFSWSSIGLGPGATIPNLYVISIVGTFIGLFAVLFRRLAATFVKNYVLCVLAVILYLFSTPVTQSNWILLAGVPILFPLFTCFIFLWFFSRQERGVNSKDIGSFFIIMLLGVWYREFFVVVPLMLVLFEYFKTRKFTWLLILVASGIPICLFPTMLPRVMSEIFGIIWIDWLLNDPPLWLTKALLLPVTPSFLIGSAGAQLTGNFYIRSEVSHHFISLLSPTLLVTSFAGFVFTKLNHPYSGQKKDWQFLCDLGALVFGLVTAFSLLFYAINTDVEAPLWVYELGVVALLLIALSIDVRLFIWISAFLFPFYLLYTERVHLAYVCMPLVLTIVAVNARTWATVAHWKKIPKRLLRSTIVIGFVVALAESLTNPLTTSKVMTGVAGGISAVASQLHKKHAQSNIDIISNVIHADDLRLFKAMGVQKEYEGMDIYLTVRAGHDGSIKVIDNYSSLGRYLETKHVSKIPYFLDVWHPRLPEKTYYHQHNFVSECRVKMGPRKTLHETNIEYLFIDPLRYFDGRRFFAFLGPPDLQDDFYFGPSDTWFHGKVYARYDLYPVLATGADIVGSGEFGRIILRDPNGAVLRKAGEKYIIQSRPGETSKGNRSSCSGPGNGDLEGDELLIVLEEFLNF